jgi:lipid-A-disaccharide synthase
VLTLMPGSRPSELKYMMPLFIRVARRLKVEYPGHRVLMPLAPNLDAGRYEGELAEFRREGVEVLRGVNAVVALAASEAAVITSGTSSLQATLTGTPMVVLYRLSPLTYQIMRRILKVKYATITNLVLGRAAVGSLLIDNLNASVHLRALLTDLFLIEQALKAPPAPPQPLS